jgi:spore coat polysaccharide biosynthesis predicted glycosyltransferase SpsG
MNKNIEIFSNTNKISNLMSQAKIFITSGGNTLIESLMFKGLRFVISTADNQILQCKSWSKLKLINYLGHITEKKNINNKIDKFFQNTNFKLIKKLNSKNFIYGKYRFLDAIKERY